MRTANLEAGIESHSSTLASIRTQLHGSFRYAVLEKVAERRERTTCELGAELLSISSEPALSKRRLPEPLLPARGRRMSTGSRRELQCEIGLSHRGAGFDSNRPWPSGDMNGRIGWIALVRRATALRPPNQIVKVSQDAAGAVV